MKVTRIDMEDLREYVYSALIDDEELVKLFDRRAHISTTLEAVENVIEKIEGVYYDAELFGIDIEGMPEGYFAFKDNLLISFGMNIFYRNKTVLSKFWEAIKDKMGNDFQCVLYSHNERAINFLKRAGMKIAFDNITVLTYN